MPNLSDQAKEELIKVSVPRQSARIAELASVIRFAGAIDAVAGRVVVDIEVGEEALAQRIAAEIKDLFGMESQVLDLGPLNSSRKAPRQVVRVADNADNLIRRVGLVTRSGHQVRGLPPHIIAGSIADSEAAWRGAFLAAGSLSDPGRTSGLEVACPCQEASLALVGCARRLGLSAKTKETRGVEKVVIRDGEAVGALLSRMGAHTTRLLWDQKRQRRESRPVGNRLANFDDANLRRSARAAVAAAARVERAMAILGDDVPDHLAQAGQLRVQHRQASLEELGRLADPQMTKDAVAGRIRRLLSMADKRAEELGMPDTSVAVTDDLLDEV
ncbi:DNA-binding protein WhiA [Corynebacterium pseudotuberculosis]|uniref:Probable cell division protein WhiA n=2 Tax=Corynebacterium pseudotuberculosis TaxID=1719 RepID=D9QAK6_CORP2|nr:DNA-binding protein WhiA [Corynebacterium pseudotuberculosis]AER69159.1 Sporulation transcription regulator whiA [Corynebacterium pseudotuberculosis 1/06-A]ADK28904.1 DNA-binding protein WhiA [Corynebacterium pseudotuberculosis FRC41]ADL10582.1 DNA-binding protein WhiA [Corynebacterium pseudotuberculosis C231]ADL20992.1 DNA-binding protein WhiA [Corynebacterium pseudotuberculosis 1002]ADO26381.1 DNA-binding protein WhiA [Corynebacterium pseudotuberculosis I19]